ncbi:hypothetical protein GCM10009630_19990 [Kribbella jejuensis]
MGASVAVRVEYGKRGSVCFTRDFGVAAPVHDSPLEGLTPNDFGKDNAKLLERAVRVRVRTAADRVAGFQSFQPRRALAAYGPGDAHHKGQVPTAPSGI